MCNHHMSNSCLYLVIIHKTFYLMINHSQIYIININFKMSELHNWLYWMLLIHIFLSLLYNSIYMLHSFMMHSILDNLESLIISLLILLHIYYYLNSNLVHILYIIPNCLFLYNFLLLLCHMILMSSLRNTYLMYHIVNICYQNYNLDILCCNSMLLGLLL